MKMYSSIYGSDEKNIGFVTSHKFIHHALTMKLIKSSLKVVRKLHQPE
jgi:hypothetical protein